MAQQVLLTDGKTTVDYSQVVEGMNHTVKWLERQRENALRDVKILASQGRIRSKKWKEIREKWAYIIDNLEAVKRDREIFRGYILPKLAEANLTTVESPQP